MLIAVLRGYFCIWLGRFRSGKSGMSNVKSVKPRVCLSLENTNKLPETGQVKTSHFFSLQNASPSQPWEERGGEQQQGTEKREHWKINLSVFY